MRRVHVVPDGKLTVMGMAKKINKDGCMSGLRKTVEEIVPAAMGLLFVPRSALSPKLRPQARKYFKGQQKDKGECCYYPDTMRLYDEHRNGKYYRIMYCKNHKKTFRIRIKSANFCLKDGVGSIENFEDAWQNEIKRFKHRPESNPI